MAGFQPRSDWVNLPNTSTPIQAADLLRYENAIANLDCSFLPCDVATTANITLSGTGQAVDGTSVTTSMRVFAKNQTNQVQNGIYVTGAGAWARASDMATGATIKSGTTVIVRGGTTQSKTLWTVYEGLNNFPTAIVNTDALAVSQVSGGGGSITGSPFLPVQCAANTNITLSGVGQTIDSRVIAANDRVFAFAQTTTTDRGIYIAASGAWARASDMQAGLVVPNGSVVEVIGGFAFASTILILTKSGGGTATSFTVNTDGIAANPITRKIQANGVGTVSRPFLNFTGAGVAVADNSTTNSTDVTIAGGSGGASRQSFTVRASSIGNFLSANGLATIDDVVLANNDLVYYQHNAAPADNRIFQVNASGPWSTWSGMPSGSVWPSGLLIHVTEGTVMGGNTYITSNADGSATYTVGTSTINTEVVTAHSSTGPTLINRTVSSDYNIFGQGNYSYFLTGGIGLIIHDPSTDNNQVINIAIQQDSVGGHVVEFDPGTIIWENGWGLAAQYSLIDLTPLSTTLIRLEWMGAAYGWRGHALTNVPPLTNQLPSSWTYQGSWNSTGATGPTGAQSVGFGSNAYSIRGYPANNLTLAMDALILLFSPAMRARLQNNNPAIEICYRWCTEGPVGNLSRGNSDNAGGFNLSLGDHRNLVVFAAWRTDINMLRIIGHEMCHLISATYYGGNNANEPGFAGAPLISVHPTLASLQTDCLANGGNASGDEFFAEMELGRRLKAVGAATEGASHQNGTAGPNTTGSSTTASRVAAFNNYMTSLAGYQF